MADRPALTTQPAPPRPSVLAVARRPEWVWGLLAVTALAALFVGLGRWQHGRYEGKVARNAKLDADYSTLPVPLSRLLGSPGTALPGSVLWRPVEVGGRYEPQSTTLIRNRPLAGDYGYEVVVPLRLPDGSALLVDRGWIPNGRTGAEPDAVPAPPAGQVVVVARLRAGEPPLDRAPPPGQELRIDLDRIAARVGGPVYRAYGVLASELPAPASAPTALPRPDEDLGPHLAYAWQWWGFAATAFGLYGYYLRREAQLGTTPRPRPGRPGARRPSPRPDRRARTTDEEWEDAASG